MKYNVPIFYKGLAHYIVEATNPQEAREKAEDAFHDGEPEARLGGEWEEIDHFGVVRLYGLYEGACLGGDDVD